VNIAVTVVHCALNYVLVFGELGLPEMGLAGAGVASLFSQALGCLTFILMFLRASNDRQHRTRSGWRPDARLLGRLLKFGVPSGVHVFVDVTAFTAFIMIVGRIGTAELAATNIAFNINSLAFMPVFGLGTAVAVLVGQHLGEDRAGVAQVTAWNGLRLGLVYMVATSVVYLTLPGLFADLFAPRDGSASFGAVRDATVLLLRFVAAYSLFDSLNIVFGSALKGAGDTRFVMGYLIVMASLGLVAPSVILIGVLGYGLITAWLVVTLYIIALALGFLLRFLTGRWKSMRVIG
jgi:MATE family multidrug resistance protein